MDTRLGLSKHVNMIDYQNMYVLGYVQLPIVNGLSKFNIATNTNFRNPGTIVLFFHQTLTDIKYFFILYHLNFH